MDRPRLFISAVSEELRTARGRVVATESDQAHSVYVHNVAFSAISETVRDSIEAYILETRREVLRAHVSADEIVAA